MSKKKVDAKDVNPREEQHPRTVTDVLKTMDIDYVVVPEAKVPSIADGKISLQRAIWVLDHEPCEVFFKKANSSRTYRARFPLAECRKLLNLCAKLEDFYLPSKVLNLIPDEVLSQEQIDRKWDRNRERRKRRKRKDGEWYSFVEGGLFFSMFYMEDNPLFSI